MGNDFAAAGAGSGAPRRRRGPISMHMAGPVVLVLSVVALVPITMRRAAPGDIDARQIYLRDCASCHDADGHGTARGPTLVGQGTAGVDFMLSTGRMPLRGGEDDVERHTPAYDRATIEALVEYVSTLVPGGPAIPDVDAAAGDLTGGGTQYRAQCAACHQSALQGGALLRGSSPDLEQATAVQVGEAMRTGPGAMPVFGSAAASDHDVDSIARYVLALQHPDDPGGQPLWHLGPLPEGAVAFVALGLVIVALRRIGTRT